MRNKNDRHSSPAVVRRRRAYLKEKETTMGLAERRNTLEIYGADDACGWRLKATNGEVLSGAFNGDGFSSPRECWRNVLRTVTALCGHFPPEEFTHAIVGMKVGGSRVVEFDSLLPDLTVKRVR